VITGVPFSPFRVGRAHPFWIAGRQRFDRLREIDLISGSVVEENEGTHATLISRPDAG
jgi:hypothetical protein